ncbi:MAG: hypothetical protein H7247_13385 [Polaromonas sp.]|nr:hypothetical protein [Gemmatimonadaceae bacterium]
MRHLTVATATALLLPSAIIAQSRTSTQRAAAIASGQYLVGIAAQGDTNWFSWTLRATGDSLAGDMSATSRNALRGVQRRDSFELLQR